MTGVILKPRIKGAFGAVAFALFCVPFFVAPLYGQVIDNTKEHVYKDREKREEIEETGKNIERLQKEIKKLQAGIVPGRINREKEAQYGAAAAQLDQEQWIEKGYALRNEGQYEDAIGAFDKAIAINVKPVIVKEEGNTGTVALPVALLRSQPLSVSSQTGLVVRGTLLLILGESKDSGGGLWYRIKLPVSKKEAWIAGNAVKREKQDIQIIDYGMHSIARAYLGKGSVYQKLGQPDKAIDNYTQGIILNPQSAAGYNNRGMAYANLGEYEKAIEDLSRALELKPDNIKGYVSRGFVYGELEDFPKAKKDLDYALHLEPQNEPAYLNRGRLHARSGNFEEAIKDYDRVLAINPESGIAYTGRGVNFAALKQYEKALKDLNAAINLNPENSDAFYSRGAVYLNMNEHEKAVEDYKLAARLGDKDAQKYLRGKGISWNGKK
ncbi:MAG: hypothetical protein C0392_11210 [Syntrophus sp. (in: bacteria)]|nr:hypothetical protein [Syntrophus sp. (in: bacteria)]